MPALQAFLISKPPTLPHATRLQLHPYRSFNSNSFSSTTFRKKPAPFSALHHDNLDSNSYLASSTNESHNLLEAQVTEAELSTSHERANEVEGDASVTGAEMAGKEKGNLPLFVFLMGFFARMKTRFEKMLLLDGFSWWPFRRQEKRLELLISEADSNPKDAAKQSALLVELNKHR